MKILHVEFWRQNPESFLFTSYIKVFTLSGEILTDFVTGYIENIFKDREVKFTKIE